MFDSIIDFVFGFENFLWAFVGVPIVLILGLVLTIQSRFAQFRNLPLATKTFLSLFRQTDEQQKGIPPLKAFFASIGGSVGVGNVVGVCTAIQIGGPGALFWLWITAMAGAVVKYSEVYLGVRYRVTNSSGEYSGGPMYFLRQAIDRPWVSTAVCVLLCLYGVEIFQFSVVANSISTNFDINLFVVVACLIALVTFAGMGGVRRVGNISSALIPLFVFSYVGMGGWILIQNIHELPSVFATVISSAFSGHAAIGAFAGSAMMQAMSHGVRRGCYTGDIGIGYASVIHSETSVIIPEKQALLVVFEIFMDTFLICTSSVAVVLVTGVWQEPIAGAMLVQEALGKYFPYMNFFMPFFLFLVGYATINAYYCVGLKCAEFLHPKMGRRLYQLYAVVVLVAFSFFDALLAQSVMAIAGGFLLVINSVGIFMLRKKISFDLQPVEDIALEPTGVIPNVI
ncbi:MAG: amino acid carrier protein [Parachlamydiaceae bacterium]